MHPIVRDASLKSSTLRRSVVTSSSHGGPTYRHRSASSSTRVPPASVVCGSEVSRRSAMQRSSCSPLVGGAVLVSAFSAADAVVAPASTAELVTSAVKTADDCPTSAYPALLPNASWPEAFLVLFDVAGGTLHSRKRPQSKRKHNKINVSKMTGCRSHDLLGCRPQVGLAGLRRSFPCPLVRPKVTHLISARPRALLSC
jgi:hypothetical protein